MSTLAALGGTEVELPKLTITSARTVLPFASLSSRLSNSAANSRFTALPGAMVFCGFSENTVLSLASMNCSWPEAAFSVKLPRFSELAWGSMCAVVASSPCVASAISEDCVFQLKPDLVCRLTTMLPMVAPAVPELVTVTNPLTNRWPETVVPWVTVIVQVTVEPFSAPVFSSFQAVSLVWDRAALAFDSETAAFAPPPGAANAAKRPSSTIKDRERTRMVRTPLAGA